MGDGAYLYWSSGNSLTTSSSVSNASKWTVSIENGTATIANVGTNTRIIRFNSDRFACYTSNTGTLVRLYRKVEAAGAYTITAPGTITGGSVTANKSTSDGNETITLTVTPDTGYELTSLTYTPEGGSATAITATGGVYSFTMPTANVTISATFTPISYTLTRSSNSLTMGDVKITDASGSELSTQPTTVAYGETVYFKLFTEYGYQATSNPVTVTPATVTVSGPDANGVYSFTMPASAVTIAATFEAYTPDVYFLAGDLSNWDNGTKMTYDSDNQKYTLRVYFSDEYGYFRFRADNATYASGAEGEWWGLTGTTQGETVTLYEGSTKRYRVPAGIYDIEVGPISAQTTLTVTKIEPTLTFSPAAGTVEAGTTVSATSNLGTLIAAIDPNATVTVGVNTDNGSTWNADVTLNTVGTTTVYGKAYIGNLAVTATAQYTVERVNTSNVYELVTSASALEAGKKYIIMNAASGSGYAMSTTQNTNNRAQSASYTITDSKVTIGSDVQVITLESAGTNWNLNVDDGYLYAAGGNGSSPKNYLKTEANVDENGNADAAISISGTTHQILFQGTATRNDLRYNSSNNPPIFSCYAEGGQNAIYLYKQTVEEVKDYTITYAEVTGGSATGAAGANEGETVTVTATPASGYACTGITVNPTATVTDNGDGTYTFTMPAANVTVTPTFLEAHTVTYVSDPANKATVTGTRTSASYGQAITVTVSDIDDDYQLSRVTYTYNDITVECANGAVAGTYTFNMPGYDVTVTAELVKKPHTITVVNTANQGTVTGVPSTATSGTTVNFTVTPTSSTYTVNLPVVTFERSDESTGTVTVTDNGNGNYSFAMPAYDVTISITYTVPFASSDYQLITNTSDLEAGVDYLITKSVVTDSETNAKSTIVMGKMESGYADVVTDIAVSADNVITSTAEMAIVTLGGSEGAWTLHTAEGYLHNNDNAKNKMYVGDTPGYATITLNSSSQGAATVTFTAPSTYNQLQYNSSSPRFAAYTGTQSKVYFWKEYNSNKVKTPSITDRGTFIGVDTITLATRTDGATIKYKIGNAADWTTYTGPFEITAQAAGQQVVVAAMAVMDGMEDSDEATHTFTCGKPTAPTFGNNVAGNYVNPMFVYPKSALAERRAYGEDNIYFYYTTDGTTPTTSSTQVTTSNSSGKYIYLNDNANLQVVTVINGIASDPAGGNYTFAVGAPMFKFRDGIYAPGGNYDGEQEIGMSTTTKTTQNSVNWSTQIWYTTDNEAPAFAFNSTTGEVTSAGWQQYTTGSYVNIPAGMTTQLRAVTIANYFPSAEWRASALTDSTYIVSAAALQLIASPASGTYLNAQNVTLSTKNAVGAVSIYYTTDGTQPSASSTPYTGAINVASDMTIKAYAIDSRETTEGKEATAEAVYKIGVQAPTFSPIPGNYYSISEMTVEIFSVTPNAKIYYTTDGSTPSSSNGTLYDAANPPTITAPSTTTFKAIAYVGATASAVATGEYTLSAADSNIPDIATMNSMNTGSTGTLSNPFQIVYMSTWRHDGRTPEFAYVRDNSGYGLIYFGNNYYRDAASNYVVNNAYKAEMGDWIPGDVATATVAKWSDGFHNEFGGSNASETVTGWPTSNTQILGNTAILPETTTNAEINAGWLGGEDFTGTDYASYVAENNLWGHYVHMRKNTVNVTSTGTGGGNGKHAGKITDESGVELYYYDGFYNFSGYNGTPDYNKAFFDNIQNNGGTLDVYAIVVFYGPNASKSSANYSPFEIFPIDFKWIYKPTIIGVEDGATYHEPKTVSLSCQSEGAQIWYKTSQMEAYELYTGPFTVDQTTTIETYSTLPVPEYNDEMESVVNRVSITIGTVEQPVISPESSVNAIGDPAITVTITTPTEGATIWYTTDGSDPKTSETRQAYENSFSVSTTTTVRAIAEADDFYSLEAEQRTYTFVKSNGIIYDLVTSESQLDENSIYVVVNQENFVAMQRSQKDNNRDAAGVLFVNATKQQVYGNDDLAVFTMKKTGSNWYFHTANGSNNASTGFLYGAVSGSTNRLLTDNSNDPTASAHATDIEMSISITSDNVAHISNIYNGENTRYLRFNKTYNLFNSYNSEVSGQPVFLYKRAATPLANIEMLGNKNASYTVADELVVVHAFENKLWVKDQGNVSIARREKPDGQIDYMREVAASGKPNADLNVMTEVLKQEGEWDQSNWAVIEVLNANISHADIAAHVGQFIKPAMLTGIYSDDVNYTIQIPASTDAATFESWFNDDDASYTPNVYCAANFLSANLTDNGVAVHSETEPEVNTNAVYFFMNPKVQEVFTVTYAVWDGNKFTLPAKYGESVNGANLHGAFNIDWRYNGGTPTLITGEAYQFKAVMNRPATGGSGAPRKINGTGDSADSNFLVLPLGLTGSGNVVTAIDDVNTANREVVGVEYYNVAGQRSDRPVEGVNIVVTRYSDGTATTAKVLK